MRKSPLHGQSAQSNNDSGNYCKRIDIFYFFIASTSRTVKWIRRVQCELIQLKLSFFIQPLQFSRDHMSSCHSTGCRKLSDRS